MMTIILHAVYRLVLLVVFTAGTCTATQAAPPAKGNALRRFAAKWEGTPYLLGGDSRAGIDCSAFVRRLYRAVFRVHLPRSTKDQIELGIPIPLDLENLRGSLVPGDLLFFVSRNGLPRHVVVYVGDGQIAHSATGRGVVIEPVTSVAGRYIAPRRITAGAPNLGSDGAP